MKRTKWLAALMAVVLSASLFTGCGAKEKDKSKRGGAQRPYRHWHGAADG